MKIILLIVFSLVVAVAGYWGLFSQAKPLPMPIEPQGPVATQQEISRNLERALVELQHMNSDLKALNSQYKLMLKAKNGELP